MSTGATHDVNISISISLDSVPTPQTGFGTVLLAVPLAANSLDGDRVRTYNALSDATADRTAGYISAATLATVTSMFAQSPPPSTVKVAYVDLVGSETYATAIAAIDLVDNDWYCYAIQPRTDAEIVAAAAIIEAQRRIFVLQTDDGSWLNSGIPSGLSAIATYERSIPFYHDADTAAFAEATAANRLVYDPDTISAPWNAMPIAGVAAYTTALTSTQRTDAIANNCNVACPYGGESFVVDPGVNIKGRPVYEIISADWLYARILEDIADTVVSRAASGQKIPMTPIGQALLVNRIKGVLDRGVQAGHFVAVDAGAYTITTSDITARQFRLWARGQFAVSGRLFSISINLGRDPLE